MKPTIYTLTGNLLWERTLEFSSWAPGRTQRARSQSFQVGGKGINVSRMLLRLGAPTEALCFAGGSTGQDCVAWLQAKGIPTKSFATSGATRVGAVIRSGDKPETTFLSPDVAPDVEAWMLCAAYVAGLPPESVLVMCGSFPGWGSDQAAPLRDAISEFARRSPLIVDTYGPPLEWAKNQPAALVKINRDEFDVLAASEPISNAFPDCLTSIFASALAHAWIVTDGAEPVWLIQKGDTPKSFIPPKIEMISPTGSGDVMLACLLQAHYHQRLPLDRAIAFALPYASANAADPGIADFDLNNLPS